MVSIPYPHSDVLDRLIFSTMRVLGKCYQQLAEQKIERNSVSVGRAVEAIPNKLINAEYAWWPKHYGLGEMRHIASTDPKNGNAPLLQSNGKVSLEATRISKIIKRWIAQTFTDNLTPSSRNYWAPSPLFLVEELLSSPTSPSFSAYSLYAIRTFLFFEYQTVPAGLLGKTKLTEFTESAVQKAYSGILTSAVPRYLSQGKDTLITQSGANGVLQQYLAYRNILVLSFKTWADAATYFDKAEITPPKKSRIFQKNNQVARMPEVAQIINELWGVPIPLRGADTLFRGGIKLSSKRGLVIAIHGGPGTGKTSLCLALSSSLSPFGIQTIYLSAEEQEPDLRKRAAGLFSDEMSRLPFFKNSDNENSKELISFTHINVMDGDPIKKLNVRLERLEKKLESDKATDDAAEATNSVPKPCRAILILDGLHDLFVGSSVAGSYNSQEKVKSNSLQKLHSIVDRLQKLQAIVILTIADDWDNGASLDYMVDMAVRLSFTEVEAYDAKPDRRITLFKARHQQCAFGTHGIQISGDKGVRFSPQINHQLDRRAIWKTRLPDNNFINPIFHQKNPIIGFGRKPTELLDAHISTKNGTPVPEIDIPRGSNIFINGNGSGGKAGLAMRIAFTPIAISEKKIPIPSDEKVLVISFLYPREYYSEVLGILNKSFIKQYGKKYAVPPRRLEVIHLYPGYLKPNDLYNRIDWEIQAAERVGEPYTTVVIDGLHNVFLQFPEIQKYPIFWPQLYNALRSRSLNIITTHTTLVMQDDHTRHNTRLNVDDDRSEPLRHALVQKTDFQITVEPINSEKHPEYDGRFEIKFLSAIGQKIEVSKLVWERETLILEHGVK